MSDSPPPKKVGSLRDRIAAFENKGSAPAAAPAAPAPRPKPASAASWKPKAPTPPDSPPRNPAVGGAGMSAADAKESIGAGGSLRERMAALQGRSGFGPAPPVAPKPAVERPKWKPPPQTVVVPALGEEEDETAEAKPPVVAPPPTHEEGHDEGAKPAAEEDESENPVAPVEGEEAEGEKEPDPQEEERQRRAAIAARMARLGGARVGMAAPPIFGKKPEYKRTESTKPKEEEAPKVVSPPADAAKEDIQPAQPETAPEVTSPPTVKEESADSVSIPAKSEGSQDYFGSTESSGNASLTPGSASSSVKSPPMPVPAGPRRAGPPRKKAAAKSPSPHPVVDSEITQSPAATPLLGDDVQAQEAVEAVQESKDTEEEGSREPEIVGSQHAEELATSAEKVSDATEDEPSHEDEPDQPVEEDTPVTHEEPAEKPEPEVPAPPEVSSEPVTEEEQVTAEPEHVEEPTTEEPQAEEEEDEAARRKRIAERLAKSGGYNPFSGLPPVRQPSQRSVSSAEPDETEESAAAAPVSPPPARRQSTRQSSTDSARQHVPPPIRRPTQDSSIDEPLRSPPALPTSPKPERKGSTASIGSNISLPARKMSQDDHKSIVHDSAHHRHQSSLSEDIVEEPESEVADELVNRRSGEAPAAHEERRTSVDSARRNLQSESSQGRRISYLSVEEEPEAPHEEHPEEEYEGPTSDHPTFTDEEDSVELAGSGAKVPAQDLESQPEPEPHPVPQRRSSNVPPLTKRTSVPPPPRAIPTTPDVASGAVLERRTSVQSKRLSVPPLAPPSVAPPPPPLNLDEEEDDEDQTPEPISTPGLGSFKSPPPPLSALSPPPPVPPLPRTLERPVSGSERRASKDIQASEVSPRPPPVRKDSVGAVERHGPASQPPPPPASTRPSIPIPPPSPASFTEPNAPQKSSPLPTRRESLGRSPPPTRSAPLPTPLAIPDEPEEQEILDDEDGDPIDPSFHYPARSSITTASPLSTVAPAIPPPQAPVATPAPPPPPPAAQPEAGEEDGEQARRRTIAERMAKLGGIRLGAPMPMPPKAPAAPRPEEAAEEGKEPDGQAEPQEPAEEEDEFARKQRIAARIAGMGGMRFGMVPGGVVSPPPPVASPPVSNVPPARREDDGAGVARHASVASRAPPPAPLTDESESESVGPPRSDEGGHIDTGESELEEISHEDAQEDAPPVPSRPSRRTSVRTPGAPGRAPPVPPNFARPAVPSGRPPIPSPASRASRTSISPARSRQATVDSEEPSVSTYLAPVQPAVGPSSPNDYVMVEPESAEEPPPLPPSRPTRPPPRSAPPPPAPLADTPEPLAGSAWELPQIPSAMLDFGGETDLSSSGQWSDIPPQDIIASQQQQYPETPVSEPQDISLEPARRRSSQIMSGPHNEINLTADDLMSQWGRVGVQIHEIAATLFEKSKKSVVGDGSYVGFVSAVISQVPNASQPIPTSYESFGYLIYSQAGAALQRRASDIMPGDIIVLSEAKLKGHKGLQMYHQNVGMGDPVVAIVADFETKRSKVKVFQANQHIGQQSVESVSYRLEDVKSGIIKIYRVLEK
ncbi:hypothetical protein EIP91_010571 [Steccherinum ochraceum]|uniref:BBC1/AIM3 cysteine proteinase-fold domain-containing protein n=1 Tax=Steccherinum ochraceum TaxID=92696 RepID=A0A4R0RQN2_9APHY|nr:hypothetical protein EIP91_010571 [Steccherinum ochraceum]